MKLRLWLLGIVVLIGLLGCYSAPRSNKATITLRSIKSQLGKTTFAQFEAQLPIVEEYSVQSTKENLKATWVFDDRSRIIAIFRLPKSQIDQRKAVLFGTVVN